jgi:predicted Fe-Mo cluster-binding NifX family protein
MSDKYIVAIPSAAPGGLGAEASGHFGHCDVFTLVTIEDGKIGEVALQQNIAHEQGGCMAPVNMLAQKNVNALIAGGMGMRPLMGFNNAGIQVFFNNGLDRVDAIIGAFVGGQLPMFLLENACGGGGAPGGCGGH